MKFSNIKFLGAESHLIASKLAAANVPVILHSRAPPEFFETYHVVDDLRFAYSVLLFSKVFFLVF